MRFEEPLGSHGSRDRMTPQEDFAHSTISTARPTPDDGSGTPGADEGVTERFRPLSSIVAPE